MTPAGRLGAFITKVKRGSIADVVGQLKSGRYLPHHDLCCLIDTVYVGGPRPLVNDLIDNLTSCSSSVSLRLHIGKPPCW